MKRGPASQSSNCAKQKGKKKELNKDSADSNISFIEPDFKPAGRLKFFSLNGEN